MTKMKKDPCCGSVRTAAGQRICRLLRQESRTDHRNYRRNPADRLHGRQRPFFQIDEKGNASGFEADLIAKIFDSIKDDCKNYAYVKVEPGYRLGEETAYTDKDGKTYIAYMAVGGLQKERQHQQRGLQFHQHGHQQPSGDLGKERQQD